MQRTKARKLGCENVNADRQRRRDLQRSRSFRTRGNHRLLDVIGLAQQALSAFEQILTFGCERQ